MREALKVGVSGVRGVVGQSLLPQVAAAFAQAFGTFVGRGSVLIGRDTRSSGRMLEHAVVSGLQSVGCTPVRAGVCPTPTLLYLAKHLGARGGIAITASHNPAPWNALKFIDQTGLFLDPMRAEELFDIYHQQEFPMVEEPDLPAVQELHDPTDAHFARIINYIDAARVRDQRFKVAVDCGNGVGALHSAAFLRDLLQCEVITLFDTPSGAFERDPEPLPEHLERLCRMVVDEKCDVGFAQDPDGDRLAVVSERGEPLGEDMTLALAVQQVLEHHEQGPVTVNLSATKSIESIAQAFGCEVLRTRIGEINVANAMLAAGSPVGGEHNGGVIIPAIHPCRDSFAGMAVVLERMALEGKKISELRGAIATYHIVKEKVAIRTEQAPALLRNIRRRYEGQRVTLLDGVHVDFGESWVHVRRSNTESVLRIVAEAPTREEAERLAADLRATIESELRGSG